MIGLALVNPAEELTLTSPAMEQTSYLGENESVSPGTLPTPVSDSSQYSRLA